MEINSWHAMKYMDRRLSIIVTLTIVVLSNFTLLNGQVPELPEELRGKNHVIEEWTDFEVSDPLKSATVIKTIAIPLDQSNWGRVWNLETFANEKKIKSIRVYGFQNFGNSVIDNMISEPKVVNQFLSGLSPYKYMLRPVIGDLTFFFGGAGGGFTGVIQFHFEDEEPILVGVASHSFFLDVHFGSFRQEFHSLPLAEALKRYLKSEGIEMPQRNYENLSGLAKMKLPKEFDE